MKRLLYAMAGSLLASACSHAVNSPDVVLSAPVQPDLVCNAQLDTDVVIAGSGFRPVPTNTLAEPTRLVLPEVRLTRSGELDGAAAQSDPVVISGRPDDAAHFPDHNSWQNERQMTIRVDGALELEPGLYDLLVQNPDGRHSDSIERALAVVPPPELTEVRPPSICVDQADIELTLIGTNFLQYGDVMPSVEVQTMDGSTVHSYDVSSLDGCSDVPDRAQSARLCTDAVFTVPQSDLEPARYRLVLTNPAPAACSSSAAIEVEVNAPPKVDSVVPANVCSGGSIVIASGEGFRQGASAELRCEDGTTLASLSVDVDSDGTTATATFGPGAVPGEDCDVVVSNPDGCEDRPLPHQTVLAVDGPILFYVAPPTVYNGITTQITLFVTALTPPFTVSVAPMGGGTSTMLDAIVDPGNDRRLQAAVAADTAPGTYDVTVSDSSGCAATLPSGLTVTDTEAITLQGVSPSFGLSDGGQAITLLRSGGDEFTPTPIVFLSPADDPDAPAIALTGVTVLDANTLTALVPEGTPPGTYNLVVVDPGTGAVGVLPDAYVSTTEPPPVVDEVTPQSIINGTGQTIVIRGTDFAAAMVSLTCQAPDGTASSPAGVTTGALSCDAQERCTQEATFDGSGLVTGSACLVRVQNGDGSYYDFSAIGVTNSSENLAPSRPGTALLQARRALSSAAVKATAASRFVYAIGGDTGPSAADAPLASVEFAPVDVFGTMSAWQENPHPLPAGRAKAASAVIGRYIYVYGGSDGTDALATGARALVLSPLEAPVLTDIDLCLSGEDRECFSETGRPGVAPGTYAYRVAAEIADGDAENLGGETLASDALTLQLPNVNDRGIVVRVIWRAPVDSEGDVLTGIIGYRVYRTPVNGAAGRDEVLLASVTGSTTEYIDDGSQALQTATPLAPGSTSRWQALPDLNTARNQLHGVAAADPDTEGTFYLYALLGKDSGSDADADGTALSSYEYLSVITAGNGRQTVGTWIEPGSGFGAGRFNHGAYMADSRISGEIADGDAYIYVSGGRDGAGNSGLVGGTEAAIIGGDGSLSGFVSAHATSTNRTGFGTAAAADRLFVFGGWPSGSIRDSAESMRISSAPPVLDTSVNSEGGLDVGEARFMPGSALQSAFIFVVGGQTDAGGAVTGSTALIIQ
jgi:hypothetical protein